MTELEGRYVEVPTGTKDRVTHVATRVAALLDQRPAASFDTFNHHRSDFRSHLQHLLFPETRQASVLLAGGPAQVDWPVCLK
jgi:hypothetical protein